MKAVDYDQLAADYGRHRQVQPAVLTALLDGARLPAGARAAEIGCGTGNYIGAIQAATRCSGWGVEPSAGMLATARRQFPGVHFVQGTAAVPGLAPASLDFVFSVDVIHHVEDVLAYFRAGHHLLRPGGLLCTVTDSPAMIARRRPLAVYFPGTVAADQARYHTPVTLRAGMDAAGLTVLREDEVAYMYQLHDIAAYRNRAYSCLHLIPNEEFTAGMARMEADLLEGAIDSCSEYLLLWATRPR